MLVRHLVIAWLIAQLAYVPVFAFSLGVHRRITLDVLVRTSLSSHGRAVQFSREAADQIAAEHGALDRPNATFGAGPHYHCDAEQLLECNRQLANERALLLAAVKKQPINVPAARWHMGRALHILQDFYSHTNWIELGNTGFSKELGVVPLSLPVSSPQEATCPADPNTLDGGLRKLTSGYAGHLFNFFKCEVPAGKCHHGGAGCAAGISKDDPSKPLHSAAVKLANDATLAFVSGVLADDAFKDAGRLKALTASP